MDASDAIALGAVAMAFLALVMSGLSYFESKRTADANVSMAESNRSMKEAAEDSAKSAWESARIAERALAAQERADHRLHAASLVMMPPNSPGTDDRQPNGRYVKILLKNLGTVDAEFVNVRLRRIDAEDWHSHSGPINVGVGRTMSFQLAILPGFFRPYEGATVIDYFVTYKDRIDNHEKWFRVEMTGTWDTNWSFKLLDIMLDGKRQPFQDSPQLAEGLAYREFDYREG